MVRNVRRGVTGGGLVRLLLRRAPARHSRRAAVGVGWWDCQPRLRGRVGLFGGAWQSGAGRRRG